MQERQWVGKTAVQIAEAVRGGTVSPVDIVEEHLALIGERDGAVNAFRLVRADEVRAEARALAERPDLTELPLAGVPVAVKDNIDVAGVPTANGSAATSTEPAAADSELITRLRTAGALLIGKTNVPELCLWPFTESRAFGVTRNPWDLGVTPGGSTGGGAAAVAADMAPLALGADGGGSIRIPSACCGIVGVKPGFGVLPRPTELGSGWRGMSEFGPMAKTVTDAALMLDVMAGRDQFRHVSGRHVPPLRIGTTTKPPALGVPIDRAVRVALESAVDRLQNAGHLVERVEPPWRVTDSARFIGRFLSGVAEDADRLRRFDLEPRTRAAARAGRMIGRVRSGFDAVPDRVAVRFAEWFRHHDLLLTPVLATPPIPIGTFDGAGLIRTMFGSSRFMPFTPPFNLTRYPAVAVPAGRTPDGIPLAVQVAAPPGDEALLLAVAALLE